jgi:hypothetical protein
MDLTKAKKALPHILMGVGMAFGVSATVDGIRSTFEFAEDGYDRNYILDKNVPLKDRLKTVGKYYWLTGTDTAIAAGCFIAAQHGYSVQIADALGVAAWYKQYAKDYRMINRELYGEENDRNIERAMSRKHISQDKPQVSSDPNELTFYDPVTRQTFYATPAELEFVEREMNDILSKGCPVHYWFLIKHFRNVRYEDAICNDIGWHLDETYEDYYYYNESFFGHIMFRILRDEYEDTPSGRVYTLRFNLEPMLNLELDADVVKDSQDLQRI